MSLRADSSLGLAVLCGILLSLAGCQVHCFSELELPEAALKDSSRQSTVCYKEAILMSASIVQRQYCGHVNHRGPRG